MHRLILDQFLASFDQPPQSLVLDFDGTDDRVHGEQEGRAYNSHYGGYGFFPLYVYCGEKLLVSYLRPINRPDAYHSEFEKKTKSRPKWSEMDALHGGLRVGIKSSLAYAFGNQWPQSTRKCSQPTSDGMNAHAKLLD
ncbi:MAG TPA: hypothetical protein EYP10_06925 [Armatimonadetes bacterium]|nr:hypothetical protein [Armatimonadota bacterium]